MMGSGEVLWLARILHRESNKIYRRVVCRRPLPDRLYHYTTAEGLLGILEAKALWATDARYLNDVSEIVYAEQLIRDEIQMQLEHTSSDLREWLAAYRDVVPRVREISESFVACFCESGDLLSQWRAYGTNGGFSVGFSGKQLLELPSCHIVRVEYSEQVQRDTIRETLALHLRLVSDARDNGTQQDINHISGNLGAQLSLYALAFKHPSFAEEREWRAIALTDEVPPVRFRHAQGLLRPFVIMPLTAHEVPAMPVVSVSHAPSKAPELTKRSLERLLRGEGYSEAIVSGSNVPLRP
jgi:hypothetical protein